jgi:hypothetical protein
MGGMRSCVSGVYACIVACEIFCFGCVVLLCVCMYVVNARGDVVSCEPWKEK